MAQELARGAEAVIFLDKNIVKERVRKSYRHKIIDLKLRKARTRREANILRKLEHIGFPAPKIISCDEAERIEMEFIEGPRVRDILEKSRHLQLSREIGRKIRRLHDHAIIHGDLTTSNMMLRGKEVYFIDFGLSFYSHKVEDKAVDLHLLKQALESKHYSIWEKCFRAALSGYADKEVIKRLEQVESRGRNKKKG